MSDTLSHANMTNNVTSREIPAVSGIGDSSEAVEVLNPGGSGSLLMLCDHASNQIPPEFDNLGLSESELNRHIGWDIGAAEITRRLSERFDAPAILGRISRLVIDVNRDLTSDSLIPETSDDTVIPKNQNLTTEDRKARIDRFYHPFHAAVETQMKRMLVGNRIPLVVGMHSFTPLMHGIRRPWVVGLLWNKDPRLAHAMIKAFRKRGLMTGDNEPYSGKSLFYSMDRHGSAHGLPQATLEVRQDEIETEAGIEKWAKIVGDVLEEIKTDPALQTKRHF